MNLAEVSACLITHNEEGDIRECLESLKGVGEIVVVDALSTDATADICREFDARVYPVEWQGFSVAKNACLGNATLPWVLSIDADERLTPGLKREIEDLSGTCDGYYVPRRNFFLGKWIQHGGWYPDYTLRLFRNGKGRFKPAKVHESVELSGKAGYLKYPLQHYTYRTLGEFVERMDRYTSLSAEERIEKGACRPCLFLRLFGNPLFTFLKMYFLRRGFMDGYHGLVLAVLCSLSVFLKYAKVWETLNERIP